MTTPDTPSRTPRPTLPRTMRAVVQRGYGDADVLDVAEIDVPSPRKGEVLLHVEAAGVDRGTWHLMTGTPKLVRLALGWKQPRGTYVAGRDVAGTVVAVGEGVTRFALGDRVFGSARGSLAEHATAVEDKLGHQPAGTDAAGCAVLAISGLTALHALDAARVGAGDRVLVTGASGGVGSYVVQLAAARGAVVTGVCSAAKADAVRRWGATTVLDYRTTDPTAGDDRYDAVIDIAGGTALPRLRRVLTPRGTIVFVGAETGGGWTGGMGGTMGKALRMLFARQRFVMLMAKEKAPADLERLAQAVTEGSLVPPVHAVRPLEQVRAAMAELIDGTAVGKLAVSVDATGRG